MNSIYIDLIYFSEKDDFTDFQIFKVVFRINCFHEKIQLILRMWKNDIPKWKFFRENNLHGIIILVIVVGFFIWSLFVTQCSINQLPNGFLILPPSCGFIASIRRRTRTSPFFCGRAATAMSMLRTCNFSFVISSFICFDSQFGTSHTVEITEIYSNRKNIPSNHFFSKMLLSRNLCQNKWE